ncbi:enoyl-CoA hydratase [Microbacterium sp. CH12i]|uniref:enoyl-CoA hydratase/isomerase family protein n=1 Tax=Microbacterium sp. CH12i TaxID=1479651 RepID=UPI00046192DD|nr:enoyl-CoA hydratase-related protein [Microbacterium sp. CH12i]KDA06725.1 enoyl-CoA hydratase [Microbacterium sp. CH12i]
MTGLIVSVEETITHIRLARPDDGNALDLELAAAFEDAVSTARSDGTSVITLTANGPLFCGGGDVAAMCGAPDPAAYTYELASSLHRALLALAESGVIVVAAVQGAAAGAGFGIVLNADYVVAAENATFLTAYSALGVSPDGGTTHLLPHVVGTRRAAALALAGRRLDARTALEWGVVNDVVAPDALTEAAASMARSIARTPAAALAATKRLLNAAWIQGYGEHLAQEAESIARLMATEESRALQHAFLARRRPAVK